MFPLSSNAVHFTTNRKSPLLIPACLPPQQEGNSFVVKFESIKQRVTDWVCKNYGHKRERDALWHVLWPEDGECQPTHLLQSSIHHPWRDFFSLSVKHSSDCEGVRSEEKVTIIRMVATKESHYRTVSRSPSFSIPPPSPGQIVVQWPHPAEWSANQ